MNDEEITKAAVAEINRLHRKIMKAARQSLEEAIRIGELLEQEKSKLRHGSWLPFLKAYVEFDERTARRYMRVFTHRDTLKSDNVTDLSAAYQYLVYGGDEEEARVSREIREHNIRRLERARAERSKETIAPQPPEPAKVQAQPLKDAKMVSPANTEYRGIVSPQMLDLGFSSYHIVKGEKAAYVLPPDVSELEHRDCVKVDMGGSAAKAHREAYYGWKTYRERHVREKLLKVLAEMCSFEVPEKDPGKGYHRPGFKVSYDLTNPEHLGIVVDRVCADLRRIVQAKKQIAKRAAEKNT